ncbi:LLM class flavin-dependent oxidoreductase [Micromonospora echinofusca]|uniref:LLM class flavin-dependent oxidoreductase n=1 Tax=Micromonospora echinofusca TaxID=47858 RepID=A0ABS3VSD2_MICEH|nr:LLM class flavin-dependent oxidoreductase [Micromonospora echinofusca]MBO4207373.1 LLM class flavin-dependent oxidoreductase [Micromonospora echinofusca]
MRYEFDVYGTALEPHPDERNTLPNLTEAFQRAEKYGFEGLLAFYNHRNLDPWLIGTTLLHATTRLVPLVALQPYALPPFTAAKLIHTLSTLHDRRIDLNLITGAAPDELLQVGDSVAHDERYDRAVEYMTVLRTLLTSDETLDHDGRFYRFQGLRTHTALPPELMPRVFVAGASEAARKAAEAVGDITVTHPEPVEKFAAEFLAPRQGGPAVGIRVGLLARDSSEAAWEIARERYVEDRYTRLKMAMRKKSDSEWSRRLANLATDGDTYDDVYWTGAYRSDKGSIPLLVGSYEEVAGYLARYLDLGIRTVMLGSVYSEEDYQHVDRVLALLRG